jgi:hypothetical protein
MLTLALASLNGLNVNVGPTVASLNCLDVELGPS